MKILVVGDGHSDIHEVAVANSFLELGYRVDTFFWNCYFDYLNPLEKYVLKIQNKILFGPVVARLNKDLINVANTFKPEFVFIYRGTHILEGTVSTIKRNLPDSIVFGYNNDDPFSHRHSRLLWRHFLKTVPEYDVFFSYRKRNICEYKSLGAKRVELLMPWFIPGKDRPLDGVTDKAGYDVVFIGHFENDGRVDYLKLIAEGDFKFGLFGPDWKHAPNQAWLEKYQPVQPVRGDLYRETLCGSKIALCFFSKLNRDTYTRRCFEIPAMGVFLLCEYSSDLANIFEDGVDVVFFYNPKDMIEKICYYLAHDKIRERIAANGLKRVVQDRHDVLSRMEYVLSFLD